MMFFWKYSTITGSLHWNTRYSDHGNGTGLHTSAKDGDPSYSHLRAV
jgi:hypothetical protein